MARRIARKVETGKTGRFARLVQKLDDEDILETLDRLEPKRGMSPAIDSIIKIFNNELNRRMGDGQEG